MNDSTRQAQQALEAVERVQRLYAAQRAACLAQPYPSADERLERLRALKRQTQRYQDLLAEAFAPLFALQVAPLPFDMPAVQISLIWHRQQHHDPAHLWLREQLHGLLA